MKKLFNLHWVVLLALIIPFLAGCDGKWKEQILNLQADSLRLARMVAEKDSTINLLFGTLNEIEDNLAAIRTKESLMAQHTTSMREMKADVRERIRNNIDDINTLLARNKDLIARLNAQVKSSNLRIEELNKTVERLGVTIAEKEQEIAALRQELQRMNIRVSTMSETIAGLEKDVAQKESLIEEQVAQMNRAYYTIGTSKELREKGILNREGGFIGIGRTNRFNKEFTTEHFVTIDIREVTQIDLNYRKVELVTTHPAGSFELVGEKIVEKLVIKNPQEFWKASRFLVVVVK